MAKGHKKENNREYKRTVKKQHMKQYRNTIQVKTSKMEQKII